MLACGWNELRLGRSAVKLTCVWAALLLAGLR